MDHTQLKDITVWLWRFYMRRHGYDPSEHLAHHWQKFRPIVKDAVRWADSTRRLSTVEYKEDLNPWQTNVRLVGIPWRDAGETLRSLDVRAMLDVFYVESGSAKVGAAVPQDILLLRRHQWLSSVEGEWFLGQAVCLSAEFGRLEEEGAKRLSEEMLEHWCGGQFRQTELIKLDFGFLALPAETETEVSVLLIEEGALRQAETFVHLLLPQLYEAWT